MTWGDAVRFNVQLQKRYPGVIEQTRQEGGGRVHRTRRTLRNALPCSKFRARASFPDEDYAAWQAGRKEQTPEFLWQSWQQAETAEELRKLRFELRNVGTSPERVKEQLADSRSVEEMEELFLLLAHVEPDSLLDELRWILEKRDVGALVAWIGATSLADAQKAQHAIEIVRRRPELWKEAAGEAWIGIEEWLRIVREWLLFRSSISP